MNKLLALLSTFFLVNFASAEMLTVTDVEKIGGVTGIHAVAKNQLPGAGGELNFAGADNKLILMVMVQPASMFATWKQQYGAKGEAVAGLGTDAFRSRTGEFVSYVVFLKGNTGVWIQSMGWKKGGAANFTTAQLEALARVALSHM